MKHVGKQISTNDKLVVLFREVPGEPDNCLVVKTRSLGEVEHDSLMEVLEGLEGQQANVLADVLHRHMNRTGRPILESLHSSRKIMKLPATDVALTPDSHTAVAISEVNAAIRANEIGSDTGGPAVIAQQTPTEDSDAMSDTQIAESLINQATMMESEAARLRAEANELRPAQTKKKVTAKKKTKARAANVTA
jgi:hypothetical protein